MFCSVWVSSCEFSISSRAEARSGFQNRWAEALNPLYLAYGGWV